MARTVAVIKKQITDQVNANPLFTLLAANPSDVALFKSWIFIQAVCIAVFEQVLDVYKAAIESFIQRAPIHSDYWLQQKAFEFQYDAAVPQVVSLDPVTFAIGYVPVDLTKRIITRVSVKTTGMRIVTVKVAKSEPPVQLTNAEWTAFQSYLNIGGNGTYLGRGTGIGGAGVKYVAYTNPADRLFLEATINYDGQYSAVISTNVIAAINTYFANIPFDGYVTVLGLTDAIQSVVGVTDIFIENLAIREFYTAFVSKTFLIQNFTELLTKLPLYAGYVVEEDTAGEDFLSKLTFTGS